MNSPALLGFIAPSGTGKTTLLTHIIPRLTAHGLKVGAVKHSHHDVNIDQPGKDSDRLRQAGCQAVVLASPYRQALIVKRDANTEPDLPEQLALLAPLALDIILIEGFQHAPCPKILLHRHAITATPNLGQTGLIALATDTPEAGHTPLPILDLNNPEQISRFIINTLLPTKRKDHS
ncbi:MAG: molybdopterin-guanine dinucleotide biosynthesis protein B [Methylococcales bacterium]|nr:molybdopterin-guanine dinucleotide biosynthesis protein B [Methylococcales bacterium]